MSPEACHSDSAKVTGRTRFTVRDAMTGKVLFRTGWIKNVVTNNGKALFSDLMSGQASSYVTYCAVGSDNTAASASDTALGNEIGRLPITDVSRASSTTTYSTFFGSPDCNGTWYEVGLLTAPSGGTLVARNVLSSPVSKNSTNTVTVDYELEVA